MTFQNPFAVLIKDEDITNQRSPWRFWKILNKTSVMETIFIKSIKFSWLKTKNFIFFFIYTLVFVSHIVCRPQEFLK